LVPFGCEVTVVRKRPAPMVMDSCEGAPPVELQVLGWVDRDRALTGADVVVLALALTDETAGFLGRAEFERMPPHAVVVNIARGGHIVTSDLVAALTEGQIAAAGLDVTDPEPLPDGHPLWGLPNCLITPHTANTEQMAIPLLVGRIVENVRRFGAGEPLEGVVDPDLGY
ncbi:MAG: NAD(P)-dependent oxidoreductase, partial [Acidimicrobiales bacterium]